MGLSRREFLMRVGQAGGYSAAFLTMQSMGLMTARAEAAVPLAVAPGTGKGVKVVILGGGISGLVAAYEMKALGYECTVLEARNRPGGRNWTVRGGDKIRFIDGSTQTCAFDAGNYQNVHVSHVLGWQEGAALSSLRAVQMISDRVKEARA